MIFFPLENACHYNQKDYHPGDEVRMGFLRLKCQDDGYKTVGMFKNGLKSSKQAVCLLRAKKKVLKKDNVRRLF